MKAKVESLREQFRSGQIKTNNAKVVKYLLDYSFATINMMRRDLNMAHQTLTSRVSDLMDMGLLYENGTTSEVNQDGRAVLYTLYGLEKDRHQQEIRRAIRRREKYNSIIKRSNEEFEDLFTEDYESFK